MEFLFFVFFASFCSIRFPFEVRPSGLHHTAVVRSSQESRVPGRDAPRSTGWGITKTHRSLASGEAVTDYSGCQDIWNQPALPELVAGGGRLQWAVSRIVPGPLVRANDKRAISSCDDKRKPGEWNCAGPENAQDTTHTVDPASFAAPSTADRLDEPCRCHSTSDFRVVYL
jgi:hypothetical protein